MPVPPDPPDSGGAHRAGFCAVVGLPNVGKSTLVNALVGQKLSIVTPKAQTTRQRLLGIHSDGARQAVFVDTPGLLTPRYLLHAAMQAEAERALEEADLVVYVADAGFDPSLEHARSFPWPAGVPGLLCLNKADRRSAGEVRSLAEGLSAPGGTRVFVTIATDGKGVPELRAAILERLPEGPPYFPADEVAAAPLRFFAAELVRETCFEELAEEVPYSIAVQVEEFREADEPVYVSATLHVERESQKGIVIGRGGRTIRRIGSRAREKVEALIERPVYLDLRVKVLPNWRRRRGALNLLGYRLGS